MIRPAPSLSDLPQSASLKTHSGVQIAPGLRVWTNDLERGTVETMEACGPDWFDVKLDKGGFSLMSADRVTTRHPFTGEAA